MIESEVGERLAVFRKIGDAEARLVFEQLELVDDCAGGVGVGWPVEGLAEGPRISLPDEQERTAGVGAGDLDGSDIRGLGTEHASTGLERLGLDAPVALELKDKEEQRDVEENQYKRDFGAHLVSWIKGGDWRWEPASAR